MALPGLASLLIGRSQPYLFLSLLTGKSISRRAQELLSAQNIVALQNVKEQQLERIARMLGATVLPTTDHMIQQNGDECIGSCENFSIRLIQDDPERIETPPQYG